MSTADFHTLRKLDYPNSAREALVQIENMIINRNTQEYVMELISDYVFLEKGKGDIDIRKPTYQQHTPPHLCLIQEFQLVVVLSEFFSRPGPDAVRNAVFLSLFGNITPSRSSVLVKLISTSVSGSIAPLLCAAGTWMQQLGCTSVPSLQLVQNLIQDFVTFSKKPSEQLKQLPMVAPRFAANFMTAVADLYMIDFENGENLIPPPDMLLEMFTEWVTDNPILCLASQELLALPSGAIAMPIVTPLAGLIRWTVLAPVLNQKGMYSKLHLALLETLLQIPSSTTTANGPATALNAQHLIQIIILLKAQACKLTGENRDPELDEQFQISLERFAQAVQVALAAKCMFGSIPQLLCLLETLPNNSLMDIVLKANKNT